MDFIEKAVLQNEKFNKLIEVVKTQNLCSTGDFIDSLDEETAKAIIKKLVYGGWKKLAE